jgi:hypothetical protein
MGGYCIARKLTARRLPPVSCTITPDIQAAALYSQGPELKRGRGGAAGQAVWRTAGGKYGAAAGGAWR